MHSPERGHSMQMIMAAAFIRAVINPGGLVTAVFLLRRRFDSGNSSSSRTDNTSQRTSSNVGRALKDTAMQTARMLRQDVMRCLSSWLVDINKQNFGLISLLRRRLVLRNVLFAERDRRKSKGRRVGKKKKTNERKDRLEIVSWIFHQFVSFRVFCMQNSGREYSEKYLLLAAWKW